MERHGTHPLTSGTPATEGSWREVNGSGRQSVQYMCRHVLRQAAHQPGGCERVTAVDTRRRLVSTVVPATALGLLFLGLVVFVVTQARSYGRTYDELLQDDYGKRTLAWYLSSGRDHGFLQYPGWYQMPQHGPFAETVVAATQGLTGEDWTTRSLVTGVFAILGVLAVALCGYELGGWWMAFLSGAGLALFPRYTGAMLNNSKDVPFTAAMAFVLWLVLRVMRRWNGPPRVRVWSTAAVGVAIGAAAAIRVVALIWYPLLGLLAIGWWLRHSAAVRDRGALLPAVRQHAKAGLIIGVVSMATMCALWPYVMLHPISNLLDSIRSMSNYPWNGVIPFEGHSYHASALPRRYVLEWLLIGSPVHLVALAVVGAVLALVQLAKVRTGDARIAFVLLYLGVPIIVLALLRSALYNGLRQFLFLIPAMTLLASYGLGRLWTYLTQRVSRVGVRRVLAGTVAVLVLGGQAEALGEMIRLHPYEYVYFSPLVGGFAAAPGRYELDYWGECNKAAAQWLARHHDEYLLSPAGQRETVTGSGQDVQYMLYLPTAQLAAGVYGQPSDFYLWSMREREPDRLPSYIPVHEERIEGYPACVVKVRPDARPGPR